MRVISAIMNFYWSHSIALQKLSNERSYKFSWILTLTEVISIRNLRFFALASNNGVHNLIKREVSREKLKSRVKNHSRRRQTTTDRQINLRSNTHGCELIILQIIAFSSLCKDFISSGNISTSSFPNRFTWVFPFFVTFHYMFYIISYL